MDGQRFDDLTRWLDLALNRKRFVAAFGALLAAPGAIEPARAKRRKRGGNDGVGAQGNGFCEGFCESDEDCSSAEGCFCDVYTNRCVTSICGGFCARQDDCPPASGCACQGGAGREDPGAEGAVAGMCGIGVCSGFCDTGGVCPDAPGCICDAETNQCVTVLCGGTCETSTDCGDLGACLCITGSVGPGICTLVCKSSCAKDADCPAISGCVCDTELGACIAPPTCPDSCVTNPECAEQGADDCVCVLDFNTADRARMVKALAELTPAGSCEVCRGVDQACVSSSECCGQLVCQGSGPVEVSGIPGSSACQRKPWPKPKDRCQRHGGPCRRDGDCCAQGSCYKGRCGEKDTHCHNDGECATGYRCQGGPLAPGHRRCRKNGRRNRNRRNARGRKR